MDNPLADLAEEKLKELNEAYDYLMNNTNNGAYSESQGQSYYNNKNHNTGSEGFQRVRAFIRAGNYDAAFGLLQTLDRNHADWVFLNGLISLNRGWYQQATEQIQTAMRMSPGNPEYASVWNNMNQATYHYQGAARQRGHQQNNLCQLCTCLYCSDCCCECCGGNLIECC